MVGNLLDNACKWAKSRVTADAKQADGAARFTVLVDDDGPGLSEVELAKGVKRGQGSTKASQARVSGSRSWPTSLIYIKATSSSSPRQRADCAPNSSCRPPDPETKRLLCSFFPGQRRRTTMKRLLLVAAVAAIALTGLSANKCSGSSDQSAQQPADQPSPPPAQQPAQPVEPAQPPKQ
jgi:hypothetical protein